MKTNRTKATAWLVAVLALAGAWSARCDQQETQSDTPASGTPGYQNTQTTTAEGAPMKCNKASGLIGMDVDNQNGQHLGHIKDIVFDFRSDRVSYVVMTTAPKAELGVNEKLIAVPLSAFSTSPDNRHLVLNADKAKIDAAAGFSKNNWPDVGNPSWGAQPVWQQNNGPSSQYAPPPAQGYVAIEQCPTQTIIEDPGAGNRAGVQDYPPPFSP